MTATQKKKRDRVPGASLFAKYKYLYHEKPTRDHADYMNLLDITRDQAYQLKWQIKKELGDAYQGPGAVAAQPHVQEVTTTNLAPRTYNDSEIDELRALTVEPTEVRRVAEKPQTSYQYPSVPEPWDNPFEEEAPPAVRSVGHTQQVIPTPAFEINLSGADAATVQSFLRLISDRPQGTKKYTLALKLIEH